MTALLEAPRTGPGPPVQVDSEPPRWRRMWRYTSAHRVTLFYLVPLMALTAAARLVGMGGSPQRIDDEGTYVAQAYAVERLGELAHYTYWYDHPPLGWLQIAAWTSLTGGFERYDIAALAGREAMVVASVFSAVMLWTLARRLRLGRPAAAVAVALFALSPLAVQFTRTVFLDNIATAWMLAAFVLAMSRKSQLLAFAGAAACFGVAVLSKETYLLLLPFLVWQLWRSAQPSTRRYTLSVAGALFVLIGVGYATFALVKGEVVPGPDRVSLWEGVIFQLVSRDGSGSVLDASSQAGRSVGAWLNLDPVLPVAGLVSAIAGLFVRRLRPYAAGFLFLFAVMFKPGYLPVPYVIAMLPFAALLVAGVLEAGIKKGRRHHGSASGASYSVRGRTLAGLSIVGGLVFVAVAGPLWAVQLRGLWLADLDRPLREAQAWAAANVGDDEQILVDDAVWVDLVEAGLPRENVVWYYKADTDSEVFERTPNGWSDYEYALVTDGMRQSLGSAAILGNALENGTRVAVYGSGDNAVEIFRTHPEGTDAFYESRYRDEQGRLAAGEALIGNPGLDLSDDARQQLVNGVVDSRSIALLAQLAGDHDVAVDDFPAVFGEDGQLARRTISITSVDSQPVDSAAGDDFVAAVSDQLGSYLPRTVERADGVLTIRYGIAEPANLLPQPATSGNPG